MSNSGTIYAFILSSSGCLSVPVPIQLEVQQGALQSPLSCVSTVCEGEVALYTTQATDCATYLWSISVHGEVLGGGAQTDTFVLVRWLESGTGMISLQAVDCSGIAYCSEPTIEQVPILGESVEIAGPSAVCKDNFTVYSLPPFEGVDIHWEVSASGEIVSGQGTPQVLVRWITHEANPAPQWISATFYSCFLNCGGADTLQVILLPKLYLRGPAELCTGAEAAFVVNLNGSNNPLSCQWRLENEAGIPLLMALAPIDTFLVQTPDQPGLYRVIAKPAQPAIACQDSVVRTFRLAAPPQSLEAIIGDTLICPGSYSVYEASPLDPSLDIRWEIQNGLQTTIAYGGDIVVDWGNSPPYQVSAAQAYRGGPRCFSSPANLFVNPAPPITITGDSSPCLGTLGSYSATGIELTDFQWEIIPQTAGTIVDRDTAVIQIDWKNEGNAIVRLTSCEQSFEFPVNIHPLPSPLFASSDTLCGDEPFQYQLVGNYQSIQWYNEAGDSILPKQNDTGF